MVHVLLSVVGRLNVGRDVDDPCTKREEKKRLM